MNELSFKLSKPIQVTKDGGFEDVYELILTAPSMKDRKQAAKLTQFVSRAQKHQEKEIIAMIGLDGIEKLQDKAIDAVDGEEVKTDVRELMLSSDEDLEAFYACFETLMLRVCTVLDETPIKAPHIEMLDLKDFENLCFEYCENFIK